MSSAQRLAVIPLLGTPQVVTPDNGLTILLVVTISGWDARKQKSEFLQRVSVTIAKGNSRVLDCMRHDWQSSTAPDLVTSTVHNRRTLAATSDPGTHDPTAATPAGGP